MTEDDDSLLSTEVEAALRALGIARQHIAERPAIEPHVIQLRQYEQNMKAATKMDPDRPL